MKADREGKKRLLWVEGETRALKIGPRPAEERGRSGTNEYCNSNARCKGAPLIAARGKNNGRKKMGDNSLLEKRKKNF